MLLNAYTAISTSAVLLVPYHKWHVPRYHDWMKDEEIQHATASEPLTLEEEYSMQQSWRQDPDKLTFITCRPVPAAAPAAGIKINREDDGLDRMLGDINLFLRIDEGDEQENEEQDTKNNAPEPQIIGEIELMIAEKTNHRRGFGKAALLCFLRYIVEHEVEILAEFVPSAFTTSGQKTKIREKEKAWRFSCLSVKIGQENRGSQALFESALFRRVSEEPNFFGEMELRRTDLGHDTVNEDMKKAGIEGYVELDYATG